MMELLNHDVMDPIMSLTEHQMLKLDQISNYYSGWDGVKSFMSGESDGIEPVNRMSEDEIHIGSLGEGLLVVYL